MSSPSEDLIKRIAVIIGLYVLIGILQFLTLGLHIVSWIVSLDIPSPIKMWILENLFAFLLFLIGIPALIVAKIANLL